MTISNLTSLSPVSDSSHLLECWDSVDIQLLPARKKDHSKGTMMYEMCELSESAFGYSEYE